MGRCDGDAVLVTALCRLQWWWFTAPELVELVAGVSSQGLSYTSSRPKRSSSFVTFLMR